MKTWIFICIAVTILLWFLSMLGRKPSQKKGCTDAIIPTYNKDPYLAQSLDNLLYSPYFRRVICVSDGLMDNIEAITAEVKRKWGDRFVAVAQKNTGKGGVLMNGPNYAACDQVFLSDTDTCASPNQNRMSYTLAEIERGTDAVGDIPSITLRGAGLLPYIRVTVKLPMIAMRHMLQQLLGGTPSIISGVHGMFRIDVLCKFGLSDRTKVESLDLTWTLVANGYRTQQMNRYIVYPRGCSSLRGEWRRQRYWIVGCTVRIRLHKRFLFSRFGVFNIFPTLLTVLYGVGTYLTTWFNEFITTGLHGVVSAMFLLIWVDIVYAIGAFSAWFHRCWLLAPLAPLFVVHVLLVYTIWIIYGLIASFIGHESQRDEPARYPALVKASTAYSHPSVTGTEKLSEA